jgi:hypothetical protein
MLLDWVAHNVEATKRLVKGTPAPARVPFTSNPPISAHVGVYAGIDRWVGLDRSRDARSLSPRDCGRFVALTRG